MDRSTRESFGYERSFQGDYVLGVLRKERQNTDSGKHALLTSKLSAQDTWPEVITVTGKSRHLTTSGHQTIPEHFAKGQAAELLCTH